MTTFKKRKYVNMLKWTIYRRMPTPPMIIYHVLMPGYTEYGVGNLLDRAATHHSKGIMPRIIIFAKKLKNNKRIKKSILFRSFYFSRDIMRNRITDPGQNIIAHAPEVPLDRPNKFHSNGTASHAPRWHEPQMHNDGISNASSC